MSGEKHPLEYLSEVQDLMDLNEFMDDPDFEAAMELALKCIVKPDMPVAVARKVLVQMEAYAFKFRMMGQVFMTIKPGRAGTDENKKKNTYFAISDRCHELAAVMKYIVKEPMA